MTGVPAGSLDEPKPSTPAAPDTVLRALADPHRRQILRLVQHTELPAAGSRRTSPSPSRRSASTSACSSRPACFERREGRAASTRCTTSRLSRCASCSPSSGPTPSPASRRPSRRPIPATGELVVTAEIRNDVIVATKHIKASPEVVFPYFADPALIVTWLGDRADLDPQPGG